MVASLIWVVQTERSLDSFSEKLDRDTNRASLSAACDTERGNSPIMGKRCVAGAGGLESEC